MKKIWIIVTLAILVAGIVTIANATSWWYTPAIAMSSPVLLALYFLCSEN